MAIAIIGLGSMGKRRARLIAKLRPQEKLIGVDLNTDRCKAAEEELGIITTPDLAALLESKKTGDGIGADLKCAVISTSPLSHAKLINMCLSADVSVFTEINLVADMYDENIKLANEKSLTLYLSSTALFRNEMRYMIDRIGNCGESLSYTYHVGQYLPDWHPWESYKDFFVGAKRTNGCREILAIELPWIVAAFGPVKDVKYITGRKTKLDIEYDDSYMLLLTHENGHQGVFTVDVVCRKAVRSFEVFGENLFITWKGTPESLKEFDIDTKEEKTVNLYESTEHRDGYSPLIIENAYESELMDFFAVLDGNKQAEHTFEKDKDILSVIDKVEQLV